MSNFKAPGESQLFDGARGFVQIVAQQCSERWAKCLAPALAVEVCADFVRNGSHSDLAEQLVGARGDMSRALTMSMLNGSDRFLLENKPPMVAFFRQITANW